MKTLQEEVHELRSRQSGKYIHWPESIKEKCRHSIKEGHSIRELQEATGIAGNTIRLWISKKKKGSSFQRVGVKKRDEARSFVIKTPLGFEIQGMDLSQIEVFLEKKLL